MRYALRDRIALGLSLVAPLVVALILVPFRTGLASTNLALILVVVVVAVSAMGNRLAGAVAALSSAVWFDFFLARPFQRFTINDTNDIVTAVLLLAVGLIVSQLAARARRLRVTTVIDAGLLARVHDTARLVQAAGSPDVVVGQVRGQLIDILGLRGCRFEYGSLLGHPARLEQDGTVVVDRKPWDLERLGWPRGEIELRAAGNGHYRGRYMLRPSPDVVPSRQARLVAVTLADDTGAALDTAGPVPDG
ncbi:DUF4118 domain-containing protein [Streptomyces sp. AK02-01A]|uniref:DUF4118 domain-containing protein n=1 Tax=Streptomyces sp. AK02-01A TaxID=3028648 RepID=UPI0029A883B2|nr:DUF4118 domain-containing protein [Streptomyces sp. AK02-01A]MDX3854524.1 DUF4118 domain-containing protein [Streptomyces sp. AK02-01A]